MGTFTKSFGAMGGYIAGSRELIASLRSTSAGFLFDNAMAPAVCQQVLTVFKIIKARLKGGGRGLFFTMTPEFIIGDLCFAAYVFMPG